MLTLAISGGGYKAFVIVLLVFFCIFEIFQNWTKERKLPWHFAYIYVNSNRHATVIFHFHLIPERNFSGFFFLYL